MRKAKPTPKIRRKDPRTGDEFIRQWAASIGSVRAAERKAGLYRGHLHNWLAEPDRRFNATTTLQLAQAANCPTEALENRWTPIKDLHFWTFLRAVK